MEKFTMTVVAIAALVGIFAGILYIDSKISTGCLFGGNVCWMVKK